MSMDAEVAHGSTPEEVRDIIISTVEQIGTTGVTAEEVSRARQQILKQRELAANDTAALGRSLSEWVAQGDWRLYCLHRDYIEQVTPEAVKVAAAHYLQRNNRTVGMFIPTEKAERVAVPPTQDIAALVSNYKGRAAIAEGEIFEATPENIEARVQRSELAEGIKVTLMPKKTRGQEAHLLLTLRYGNEDNLKNFESAAGFLPELMLRGTKKLSHQQLRDELDRLSANLSAGAGGGGRRGGGRRGGGGAPAGAGSVTFSIQAKRDTLPAVIEILGQVLREPLLPAKDFEVLKSERLAAIEQMRTEPGMLAPRLLQRELNPYSKDDIRYVTTVDESIERLKNVEYEQVAQLYKEYLGSQAGELTIVGDFDSKQCLPILERALTGWKATKPYARIAMPISGDLKGGEHQIRTPDKANATYTAGLLFPLRDDDPDYPALVVGNYILGASTLSSRLGDRIRQKEGLSYGVSSGLSVSSQDKRAGLTITAICNPQNISRVEKCAQEEIERLLRDGVTKEELENARQGYLQGQKVARASDVALAGILTNFRHLGRTMAFEADVEKRINGLTVEQVNAALRKYIDPKKLVIVTAGDFETKVVEGGGGV
jgi:zinc protease